MKKIKYVSYILVAFLLFSCTMRVNAATLDENIGGGVNKSLYSYLLNQGLEMGNNITVIEFKNTLSEHDSMNAIDISQNKDKSVIALIDNNRLIIEFDRVLYLNEDSSYLFANDNLNTHLGYLTEIKGMEYLNTSQVTNMAWMFTCLYRLTSIDVSHFDTSKVVNMSGMFSHLYVTSINVNNFDTSKVTDMSYMFESTSLTSLDISSFDTSHVTNMASMFSNMEQISNLDVSHFDTSNVTNMSSMFSYLFNLKELDISNFDTSKVTDMSNMFNNCNQLTSIDVTRFDTSNVTNMSYMFGNMNQLEGLDVTHFDTSNVAYMNGMFQGMTNLEELGFSNFDTSNVVGMAYMFEGSSKLKELDLSSFTIPKLEYADLIFANMPSLETIYVSRSWERFGNSGTPGYNNYFGGSISLVGMNQTTYNPSCIDFSCMAIDGINGSGYLSIKDFVTSDEYIVSRSGGYFIFIEDKELDLSKIDVGPYQTRVENDKLYVMKDSIELNYYDIVSLNLKNGILVDDTIYCLNSQCNIQVVNGETRFNTDRSKLSILYQYNDFSVNVIVKNYNVINVKNMITSSNNKVVYDGKMHGIQLENPSNLKVRYADKNGNYTLDEMPMYSDVGEYTIKYQVFLENDVKVTGEKSLIIKPAKIKYQASDKRAVYDEKEHGIDLKVIIPTSFDVRYADASGAYTLTEMPKYKNVGTYEIKYRITAPNYEEVIGSNQLTIESYGANVIYETNVESKGWLETVANGAVSGTVGSGLRMEALKINLENQEYNGDIEYRTHIQREGWESTWKKNGELSGTIGKDFRLEAIQIRLTGEMAEEYDVYYRIHVQRFGWLDWAKNGEMSGTSGFGFRVEAIQIQLVKKGGSAPGSTARTYVKNSDTKISYQTQVQQKGWQASTSSGGISGTIGSGLRMEALKMNMNSSTVQGGIEYRTYIQRQGWETTWKKNGELSGTLGQGLRLETVQIRLTGEMANIYDIYYRVYVQRFGWLDWAKNGESAGSTGYGYRVEAIQVILVQKYQPAPGDTTRPFVNVDNTGVTYQTQVQQKGWLGTVANGATSGTVGSGLRMEALKINLKKQGFSGDVEYKTYIQRQEWETTWKKNGELSGTTGQGLRLEAVQIRLTGEMAKEYDIYYRVQTQRFGWLGWAKNGESAGTAGYGYRVEAIQIVLVRKGMTPPGSTVNHFHHV